ncbi:MAG: porin family protein [Burkholderiales bacterium]|nr:porin family protein [Burkholderiales bacterium]
MQSKNLYSKLIGILLLASSVTASAQVYVGGGLGVVKPKISCWTEYLCNKSEASFKLIGGYTVDKNFAIELNYFDLGSQDFSFSSYQEKSVYHIKSSALSLTGLVSHHFTDNLGGFAKFGFAHIKSIDKFSASHREIESLNYVAQTTYKDPHFQLGVGLTYKLSDQLSLRAEYEQFRLKSCVQRTAFQTVNVGAQYAF